MKLCQACGQRLAEEIAICPACGSEVAEGRKYIRDYRIEEVLHEGHASILCRAVREGEEKPVMIRLFTAQSGVNEEVANRLKRELEELKKLPAQVFVAHHEIKRTSDGLWYRVSEWVDAVRWGDLIGSGRLTDYRVAFDLFAEIASALEILHQKGHFIPHLILNDIMVVERTDGRLGIKIDYKLSRFFDPKLDQPGPMLKHLLSCHPDIRDGRPLDFRSDIWSLGRVFVQILTADYETCDFLSRIDELPLPDEVRILLRTMLADDPDLRPRSMREVAEILEQVTGQEIAEAQRRRTETASRSARMIQRLRQRQRWLGVLVGLLVIIGGLIWFQSRSTRQESPVILEGYANRYAPSVAFVVVEYWVTAGGTRVYRNRSEGTAFLVDKDGYLLTNRHVACPWLEDETLPLVIARLMEQEGPPEFGYRMLMWFEGAKAFNRSASLMESSDVADIYFVGSAFRSDGVPRLSIAGVARPPKEIRQLVRSPLRDDFAVLKIDQVPEGLEPLPLDRAMEAEKIRKLSQVISLGFPLGSQTQAARVNVSVVRGHVRRSFEDLLQIDASFYGGSSGGPVIDTRGKVIGIASGVAVDRASGLMSATPLWNMAMVLPITKAAAFVEELKTGQIKWNGVLDLTAEAKLRQIMEEASRGDWTEAMTVADEELKRSLDPTVAMAGGMMHFCAGDPEGARRLFDRSLSIDPENGLAGLMTFLIDWLAGRSSSNPHRDALLSLDWRSPAEFMGYLVRILEGRVEEELALKGWDSDAERAWISYLLGLMQVKRGAWSEAERFLREAVLAADADSWGFFLSMAELERVQRLRMESLAREGERSAYQKTVDGFRETAETDRRAKRVRRDRLVALRSRFQSDTATPKEKRELLEEIFEVAPSDSHVLVELAFYCAMEEAWGEALKHSRVLLERNGRENSGRLSVGLLEPEILHYLGCQSEARASLEAYTRRTQDSWHRALSDCLLGRRTVASLRGAAGESPESLVTLHVALGFWQEGLGDDEVALEHYREALESFMTDWLEFDFARERIKVLRQSSEEHADSG